MAKNYIGCVLGVCLLATSCFSRSSAMTYNEFDGLQTGTGVASLQEQAGKPYEIHEKKDGTIEYEYVERISNGGVIVAQNHYFIILKDGKIVGKYMTREQPPPYKLIYQTEPNYSGGNY